MALVVGLGNPGPRYQGTRHNAGFLVVDELARRWGSTFDGDRLAKRARHGAHRLLKPWTFMNLSGRAVQAEMTRLTIPPTDLVVVHDDLDLPLGRIRIKRGGGAGGQKGIRDIAERIGPDFARVRVGIGRPPERWTVENWVLSRFRPDEEELVSEVVALAADAVELLLEEGLEPAMNRINGTDLRAPEEDASPAGGAGEGRSTRRTQLEGAGRDAAPQPDAADRDDAAEDQPNRPET